MLAVPERPIEEQPAPAYSDAYGQVDFNQDGFNTQAKVASKSILPLKLGLELTVSR